MIIANTLFFIEEAIPTMSIPNPDLASSLSNFLDEFARLQASKVVQLKTEVSPPDCHLLSNWLSSMITPLEAVHTSAWSFDPWEVAGLGRDEVRNSSVLAWLLNPKGSHGFGSSVLQSLLSYVHKQKNHFPYSAGGYCNVRTEICPNGDLSDRLDIEIDADNFYLIIEVKIGAIEGNEQLSRYARLAQTQKGQRPWAIIYLTPRKKMAKTAGDYADSIVNLSWVEMAGIIENSMPNAPETPSKSWYAANHAAALFAKHIRNY